MLKVEAALSDLEKIETAKDADGRDLPDAVKIIRALKVFMKFLSTMRSNQLLTEDDKKRIKAEADKKRETKNS
jgi:hypothetical protein